jgi:hypothetical protein
MDGTRAQLAGAAMAAAMSLSLLGPVAPVAADNDNATESVETTEIEHWATFHGCIVTINDEYVVVRAQGVGRGPDGLHRFARSATTQVDPAVDDDACVAVVAWQENGEWYAASITAEHDGDGTVEITRRRRGDD